MSFSILPFALVDITIRMRHSANTMKNSVFSHSLKLWLILKNDSSKSSPFYPGSWLFVPVSNIHAAVPDILRVIIPCEVLVRYLVQKFGKQLLIHHGFIRIYWFSNPINISWLLKIWINDKRRWKYLLQISLTRSILKELLYGIGFLSAFYMVRVFKLWSYF